MDKITLTGLEFYAHGGVSVAEQEVGQRYRADIELSFDLSDAAQSDELQATISYADVCSVVIQEASSRHFNLIESLAGRIAERILHDFPAAGVTLRLHKLLPPIDGAVASAGVEMTRANDSGR